MAKFSKSRQEDMYEDERIVFTNNNKRKSNQYDKCKNYDCDENDDGFCHKHKNKAKHNCRQFR